MSNIKKQYENILYQLINIIFYYIPLYFMLLYCFIAS